MKKMYVLVVFIVLLSACSNHSKKVQQYISPIKAVELSAASAPESYKGTFEMTVRAGVNRGKMIFLNSELDYRDQRNLTVVLRPSAIKELAILYEKSPLQFLLDKKILVIGEAKRMKIWMFYKEKKLQKYYYQTHIFVKSADQITVL